MATNFPTNLDDSTTIPVESAATKLSVNHVTAHQNIQDALEAIEAKIGVDGSADTTSHDYKLSGVTGSDKAVSKTGTETLTNKTLTTPVITSPTLNLGSDAEGDTYYRNSSGALVRLPRGTDNYIYKMNGNVPNWEAEATIANASTTSAGIVEEATQSEVDSGTSTGSTGARLFVNPSTLSTKSLKYIGVAGESITAGNAVVANYYFSDGGITYDNKSTRNTNISSTGGTDTFSYTVGSGSNRILIVYLAIAGSGGTTPTPTSVTYNGTTMTAGNSQSQGANQKLFSYYLLSPSTGANNVVITMPSAPVDQYISVAVQSYSNVGSVETSQGSTSAGSSISTSYTVNTLGTLISSAVGYGGTISPTGNSYNNNQYSGTNTYTAINSGDSGLLFTTGSQTVSWNPGWNLVAIGLIPFTTVSSFSGIFKASASSNQNTAGVNRYTNFIGFANESVSIGQNVGITVSGYFGGLSGLSANKIYYLSNTDGSISTTPGTNSKKVGISVSTTEILLKDSI